MRLGNITRKSDYGENYQYTEAVEHGCGSEVSSVAPGPNAVTRLDKLEADGSTRPVELGYDANGNVLCSSDDTLEVRYDAFNLPRQISRGVITDHFEYGPRNPKTVEPRHLQLVSHWCGLAESGAGKAAGELGRVNKDKATSILRLC